MKRSMMGLMYLIQGMQAVGVDVEQRLEQIGIRMSQLDPQAVIHRDLELRIQQHLTQNVPPFLGLAIGQHYTLAGYGPFLMLLMTAKNVAAAFEIAMYYQRLTYIFGRLSFLHREGRVVLIYHPIDTPDKSALLRLNAELSGTFRFIRDIYQMSGLPDYAIQVTLPIEKPQCEDEQRAYYDYYGAAVRFSHTQAEFCIDEDILTYSLASADEIMHRVYRQRCDEELLRLGSGSIKTDDLVVKVIDYLSLQKEVIPSLANLALTLNMPERTLRHQLNIQNTSFQKIRAEVLQQKAMQLLEDEQYTIEEVGQLLGYAETAAFNHAFKRWFAQTPTQFRQQIRHKIKSEKSFH